MLAADGEEYPGQFASLGRCHDSDCPFYLPDGTPRNRRPSAPAPAPNRPSRNWDSRSDDATYGDAAARVLCRLIGAEPGGRTLIECLERRHIAPDRVAALANAIEGDGTLTLSWGERVGVECKASTHRGNVCISDFEFDRSLAKVLAAWVPGTEELCWFTTMERARAAATWIDDPGVWLVCRDRIDR